MDLNFKFNWKYIDHLVDIETGQGGRMISTALVLFVAWVVWRLIRLRIASKINDEATHEVRRVRKLRERFFLMRNGVVALATLSIVAIWGSTLGGFAISVAAVAGAMLVVAKEFLLNMLGFAMFSMTRPFRLGDHIQIGTTEGRVSDIGILAFEVEEIDGSHLLTGRLVSIPNGAILTTPLHKMSTGEYAMRAIEVHIENVDCVLGAKQALQQAAQTICAPWLDVAKNRLQQLAQKEMLEFSNVEPQVLIDLSDHTGAKLSLRFPCKANEHMQVEQAILAQYLMLREGTWRHDGDKAQK